MVFVQPHGSAVGQTRLTTIEGTVCLNIPSPIGVQPKPFSVSGLDGWGMVFVQPRASAFFLCGGAPPPPTNLFIWQVFEIIQFEVPSPMNVPPKRFSGPSQVRDGVCSATWKCCGANKVDYH